MVEVAHLLHPLLQLTVLLLQVLQRRLQILHSNITLTWEGGGEGVENGWIKTITFLAGLRS